MYVHCTVHTILYICIQCICRAELTGVEAKTIPGLDRTKYLYLDLYLALKKMCCFGLSATY